MKQPIVKNLSKKLEKIKEQSKRKLTKELAAVIMDGRNDRWAASLASQLKNPLAAALPLRYLKTRNVFVNYKESCGFNPVTGEGHSYRWYSLSRVIKGKLVLNTYRYSNQTAKHISKFASLFRLLGLKYIEIEAPKGLQDLESARLRIAFLYGQAIVERKYARKPNNYRINHAKRMMSNARKIGITFPVRMLNDAIELNETLRRRKLDRLKAKRQDKQVTQLVTEATNGTIQPDPLQLHLVKG